MNDIKKFIDKFGWFGFVRFLIYPGTVLITTPLRLLQTLWNCRKLIYERRGNYAHFNFISGLNCFFYRTGAINLYRHGRRGRSPTLGLGNYNMARWFYYSIPSLYAYWKAPNITVLAGMFVWLFSHLVWLNSMESSWIWICIVIAAALISTNFYANTFRFQNYNVLGWMFFPAIIWAIFLKNWIIVSVLLFLASYGSFTVVFITNILLLVLSIIEFSFFPLLAAIPATVKLLTHFYPFIAVGGAKETIISVAKAIGITRKKTKYKRKRKGRKLGLLEIYHLLLNIQFILFCYFLFDDIPILLLIGFGIYIVNAIFMRFADEQSIYIMMLSLATAYLLSNKSFLLLGSYWLMSSPLPLLIGFDVYKNVLDVVPEMGPFPVKKLILNMEKVLEPIKHGQKILMAFNDPNGIYENIFDGYRHLIELPNYISTIKEIHLLPDWWGVLDLNYEGAPQIWGRDVESVKKNMKYWKADYVIIYQENSPEIENKWEKDGFEFVNEFDWDKFKEDFKDYKRYSNVSLKWFLLKKRN
ncbi:MAG: hypothetical protein ABII90_08435 [Bacteroidota bacterium]